MMVISFIPHSRGCDFQVADQTGKPLFRLVLPETLYENHTEPVDHIQAMPACTSCLPCRICNRAIAAQ